MRNEEEMKEWYDDMRDEARRDELHEINMRKDYDYFLDDCEEEIIEFSRLHNELKHKFEAHQWEFELDDIIR